MSKVYLHSAAEREAINRNDVRNAQLRELWFVGYYLLAFYEFVVGLAIAYDYNESFSNNVRSAYDAISLHQEQRKKQKFAGWAVRCPKYFWLRYL